MGGKEATPENASSHTLYFAFNNYEHENKEELQITKKVQNEWMENLGG